jgi:hypothetical protein
MINKTIVSSPFESFNSTPSMTTKQQGSMAIEKYGL